MRVILSAFALGVALLLPSVANATPVTYTLNLTNIAGNVPGGNGSFTIANAPATGLNQVSTYLQADGSLSALSISIDGQTFPLANAAGTVVQFTSGALSDLTFFGFNSNISISLATNGLVYSFFNANNGDLSIGTLSATAVTPPISPVPEPSSLALFGSGVVGLAGLLRRRLSA